MEIYEIQFNKPPLKGQKFYFTEGVTYLVGPNGAGKSQMLEALRHGAVTISHLNYEPARCQLNNYSAHNWPNLVHNKGKSAATSFSDLNPLFNKLNQPTVELVESKQTSQGTTKNPDGSVSEKIEITKTPMRFGSIFTGDGLSSGTEKFRSHFDQRNKIIDAFPKERQWGAGGYRSAPAKFVLWDEPENSFHPNLQRILPEEIDHWSEITKKNLKWNNSIPKLFVFVATHSPFILNGISSDKSHHVVCLDNCEVTAQSIDVEQGTSSIFKIQAIANKLLGLGLEDIFPHPIIYTEGSIQVLLEEVSKKLNFNSRDFFINPVGDSDGEARFGFIVQHLNLLNKLRGRWPECDLLSPKISYVIDSLQEKESLEVKIGEDQKNIEVYNLGTNQLEDIYPSDWIAEFISQNYSGKNTWDRSVSINEFLYSELSLKSSSDKGAFKCNLARHVAEKINHEAELIDNIPELASFFQDYLK